MKRELGILPNTRVVGIVANLRPVKAVDIFLKAAAMVYTQINDVRFLIIGDGDERKNLESLAVTLNIDDCV